MPNPKNPSNQKPRHAGGAQAPAKLGPKAAAKAAKKRLGARPAGPGGHANRLSRNVPAGAVTLERHALVYLNVPKSACTTIKNQMYFMEHGRYIDEPLDIHAHDGLLRSRESTPETLALFNAKLAQPHLAFTFVRHPGKRAYSCFGEKIFNQSKYSFPKIRDYIAEHYPLALPAAGDAGYTLAQHRANFLAFLDFVGDNFNGKTEIRTDAHWGRQSTILDHFQRFFYIDFIGRVEDFSRQFAYVVEQARPLNRPDLSVRFNEGPKPPYSYEEIATPEVEQRLRELYAEDYQRLGYLAEPATPPAQG